jgi:hypothetical protein
VVGYPRSDMIDGKMEWDGMEWILLAWSYSCVISPAMCKSIHPSIHQSIRSGEPILPI